MGWHRPARLAMMGHLPNDGGRWQTMTLRVQRIASVSLAAATLSMACAAPAGSSDALDAGPTFVATEVDFQGFPNWESFDGGTSDADMLDGGQRTLYLNKRPPHDSLVFPLGTIIVKTTEGAQTFAMAKRGGGFNPIIDDWEWFEIAQNKDGTVQIIWRGQGPPSALGYGTAPPTGCTACHLMEGYLNDYVAGASLQLSSF